MISLHENEIKKFFIERIALFFLMIVLYTHTTYSATIISGKPDVANMNFSFFIKQKAYDPDAQVLFIGSNQPITVESDKSLAVTAVGSGNNAIIALTPEKITHNNLIDQSNPLYGEKINHIAISQGSPLIVSEGQPNRVHYIYQAKNSNRFMVSTEPLLDSNNDVSPRIIGLTGFDSISQNGVEQPQFFAALAPNSGGAFGTPGSTITQGLINKITSLVDENHTKNEFQFIQTEFKVPLDITSSALTINADLASINNDASQPVVMHSNKNLQVFYTGLNVTGGPNNLDGARAITIQGNQSVAPDDAIENNSIIGGRGANIQVSTHHITSLKTSTHLDYLIIVGGVGNPQATSRSVYALPLIGQGFADSGVLAKKNSAPQTIINEDKTFKTRRFVTPATAAGDLYTSSDMQVKVGGDSILPGNITDIFAEKDAIYVAIGSNNNDQAGGIFYSQALFDHNGTVQGWTNWKKTAGTSQQIFGIALDKKLGRFWFMPGSSDNPDPETLQQLYRTEWGPTVTPFSKSLQDLFDTTPLGIQALVDFNSNNPAFDQNLNDSLSIICATGYQTIVLAQSGSYNGTKFQASGALTNPFISDTGSLAGLVTPVDSLVITGGVINELGSIIAATIVSDDVHSWLVVGGTHGLAILAQEDGSGWIKGDLQNGFNNIPSTATFKKIGSYNQIKTICADNEKLYVLTNNELLRIDMSADVVNNINESKIVHLATPETLPESVGNHTTFFDVIVSGKLALLATDQGLLRVGNGGNIATALKSSDARWTTISLPENCGPVTRFFTISGTNQQNNYATDQLGRPGNIYVLNAYTGYHQTKIYRLTVKSLPENAEIDDVTVALFNDFFALNNPSFYFSRGNYRNHMATDGALLFMSRSAYWPEKTDPFLEIINPIVRSGIKNVASGSSIIMKMIKGNRIGKMIQCSASGSWLIPGNILHEGA